jgi:hypothetical protein
MESNLKFRRALFWDIHENEIERALVESDDWVVVRVFEYGTLNDIFNVVDLYGKEKVKSILIKSELRPMARAMAFLFLGVDTHKRYAA